MIIVSGQALAFTYGVIAGTLSTAFALVLYLDATDPNPHNRWFL